MTENHVLFSGKCPLRLSQLREFLPGPRTVEENVVGIVKSRMSIWCYITTQLTNESWIFPDGRYTLVRATTSDGVELLLGSGLSNSLHVALVVSSLGVDRPASVLNNLRAVDES